MEHPPMPESCLTCEKLICKVTVPRFHYKHLGKESTTLVDGTPAQDALLWDFFEFALKYCFQVQDFRVMLFYGLYEHDLKAFLRETGELRPETVVRFLRRTNQVVLKLTEDFKQFKRSFGRETPITDLIPNMITILQMQLLQISQAYINAHKGEPEFYYTLSDIMK